MSTRTMEYGLDRPPDVERAAERLARPHARVALLVKRVLDVALALLLLVAVLPVLVLVLLMLGFAGEGLFERRVRLGRHGRSVVLTRFCDLPGGAVGRWLSRAGARELPLLLSVVRGRLSFVGPRMVEPGTGSGHTGPRRLMAPGLIGPGGEEADDAYVEAWSLRRDLQLLVGRRSAAHQSVSKSSS